MTVKDIISYVMVNLNRDYLKEYEEKGQNASEQTLKGINDLVTLTNLVINELACSYIPLKKREKVTVTNGKVYYNTLSENVLKIIKFTDYLGNESQAKQYFDYAEVDGTASYIEYEYLPTTYGLTDVIGYQDKDISARALSYGVTAEFLLTEANFEQAVFWRKRYEDEVSSIVCPKNRKIKGRDFYA